MVKMKTKNKISKFISGFLIVSILIPTLFFSQPKQADAQFTDFVNAALNGISNVYTFATKYAAKAGLKLDIKREVKELFKQAKRVIIKRMYAEMTKSTIAWINSNYHGAPSFLERPGAFFNDIQKSEIKKLVNQIGYDRLKFPFGKQFALEVMESYKNTTQRNAEYTLGRFINDPELLESYRNNFYVGGWNGFLLNTQYPANNPMGFHLTEAEKLGAKLQGTVQNKVAEVKDTLQQGQGFLSPKKCLTNSSYNNGSNEFNKPEFNEAEYLKTHPYNPPAIDPKDPSNSVKRMQYDVQYKGAKNQAKLLWSTKNTCPGGLVNTTPGKVIAEKAVSAVMAPEKQGEIAQLTGDALGAIFDAFFYKLMNDGLNSMKKQLNPQPQDDDFSYEGVTLGSPSGTINGSNDIFGGPDEEIILDKFKQQIDGYTTILNDDGTVKDILTGDVGGGTYTPGDIENTKTEIELLDNTNIANPGIIQLLQLIPKQVQVLDQCIPGPDKGWESRMEEERDRVINSKLMGETASTDYDKVKAVNGVMRDLKFAVASFKEWLTTKIISELPNSIIFLDAIKDNEDMPQQIKESSETKRTKAQTLARLRALKISLSSFTAQPVSTDANFASQEKKLVAIRKQYNAIQASISNATTLEETRSTLNNLKERLSNLRELVEQCKKERTATGWGAFDESGKGNSILQNAGSKTYTIQQFSSIFNSLMSSNISTTGTEVDEFCNLPTYSGYSHGEIIRPDDSNGHGSLKFTFRNQTNEKGSPGYEDVPMVNAQSIYGDDTKKFNPVSVDISCTYVHKANLTNYTDSLDPSF